RGPAKPARWRAAPESPRGTGPRARTTSGGTADAVLSRSGGQARPDVVGDVGPPGVALIALGEDRVGDTPVGPDRRVVPGQAVLIGVVVVVIDEIREQDVGEGRKAVGHPRWDIHALIDVAVEFDDLGGPIRAGADAQVVQDNADTTAQRIPIVR